MTGERLLAGRYRMERLLGTGGMAAVWRAHDERLDRPVAVKELTGDGLGHPRAQERFEREARTVARLAHPNIVAVYDFGTEDGDPYLVMELVDGRTVAELLADGPLPVADVLAIATQTCDGLAAAHAAGIVHRDVKPANLIVTPSGVVKIFDFGIARYLDEAAHPSLTASSVAMGSATYMSPEQINSQAVDARTDLYALGCSLYEMLSGTPPFTGGTPLSIAHQQVTQPPEPLRDSRPEIPAELDALVAELLAKVPDDRPRDAAQVRRRLAALAADQPPSAVALPAGVAVALAASAGSVPGGASPASPALDSPALPAPGTALGPVRRTRRRAVLLAVLAAAAALLVVGALLATPDTDPVVTAPERTPSASPSASPSPSPSASAAPSRAPVSRTTTSRPPAPSPTPVDPIVAMRLSIQHQVDLGNLNSDTARDLNHMVDDLAKSVATGNTGDEQKKLKALNDKLTSLYKEGRLSADGYQVLKRDLDRLAAAIL